MAEAITPLSGSSAVVTGASRGLGRLFAQRLATLGANTTLVARSADELAATAATIEGSGGNCLAVVGDVADDQLADETMARTAERFGAVDLLVNNAGTAHIAAFKDEHIETWWDVITVNLRAPAAWTKAALPSMRRQGSGRIINVSSPAANTPLPFLTSYSASKAALSQFTAALALEIAPDGIVALAIGPSALTDMTRTLWNNDVMPESMRDRYRQAFGHADVLEQMSLDLFECFATGGADHVTGQYGGAAGPRFDTPADIAQRPPSAAAALLPGERRRPTGG